MLLAVVVVRDTIDAEIAVGDIVPRWLPLLLVGARNDFPCVGCNCVGHVCVVGYTEDYRAGLLCAIPRDISRMRPRLSGPLCP